MRREATSAKVLHLPTPAGSSVRLDVIEGRQQVIRVGIFITIFSGKRRTAYQQLDGETILADECKCFWDWIPDFVVTRKLSCPIDQHRAQAIREASED